ncbi:hypothetical protein J7K27_02115 [Candidatus Bathyarchaeota archaeon]|nr:hypothetical protein [Candidatus Bathyarchaeota archaeon]
MATFEEEKKRFRVLWARATMILAQHRDIFRNKNDVIEAALDLLEEALKNNPEKLKGKFK